MDYLKFYKPSIISTWPYGIYRLTFVYFKYFFIQYLNIEIYHNIGQKNWKFKYISIFVNIFNWLHDLAPHRWLDWILYRGGGGIYIKYIKPPRTIVLILRTDSIRVASLQADVPDLVASALFSAHISY